VTSGGNSHKHDRGGDRSGAGNRLRPATHERGAARAGAHPGLKVKESQSWLCWVIKRPTRHSAVDLTSPG
jgi:hypothetical protein